MIDAAAIAKALNGRKAGRGWVCRCPAHDDRSPSLSVSDKGGRVLARCHTGCSQAAVIDALKARDLWPTNGNDDRSRHAPRRAMAAATARPYEADNTYERGQRRKAAWLWQRRQPIEGSIAERYLREVRGYAGPLPPTLGFLPASKPEHHPTMIAAFAICQEPEPGQLAPPRVTGADAALHFTLLRPDGSDKADVPKPKITVGQPLGRPIMVAPCNDLLGLAITEGIEDALTVHASTGLGAWAAASAGFMPKLAETVPDYVDCVTIFAHADLAGQRGAIGLAELLRARGIIEVRIEGLP